MRGLLFVNLVFFFPNEQHLNFFTLLVFPNFYLSQNISGALKHRNLSLIPFYKKVLGKLIGKRLWLSLFEELRLY